MPMAGRLKLEDISGPFQPNQIINRDKIKIQGNNGNI